MKKVVFIGISFFFSNCIAQNSAREAELLVDLRDSTVRILDIRNELMPRYAYFGIFESSVTELNVKCGQYVAEVLELGTASSKMYLENINSPIKNALRINNEAARNLVKFVGGCAQVKSHNDIKDWQAEDGLKALDIYVPALRKIVEILNK